MGLSLLQRIPHIGRFAAGTHNAITDVGRVTVGHATIDEGDVQTGVTVIRPHSGNLFMQKVPAGLAVINGFGKSAGLVQIEELGVLETPIALTNTFSVPAVTAAQIRQCVAQNPECGRSLPTVNALAMECNDGYLNDIQRMVVAAEHYDQAFADAQTVFPQGAVGAGRGMSCFKLKGGIGSASRVVSVAGVKALQEYTVGALVLANFGQLHNLTVAGRNIGAQLAAHLAVKQDDHGMSGLEGGEQKDKGSIIMVMATDAPLDSRQLNRLALRAAAGLARTGSYYGHGSGDIALAFSTAYTISQSADEVTPLSGVHFVRDEQLDVFFEAVADCVEQSVLCALWHAQTVTGRSGHQRLSLSDALALLS